MSHHFDTCGNYNLYSIETRGLNPSWIYTTGDPREVKYKGIIDPKYIKFERSYNTRELDAHHEFIRKMARLNRMYGN